MKCVKVIKHATVTLSQCTASTCQRMRLLSIDHGVWKDILLNWLGSLRQIVRLDFAVGVSADFRKVFAQLAFPLPATVSPDLLVGLCSWMKLRDVYLNRIEVKRNFIEWDSILSWCRNRLLHLHILGNVSRREWPIKAHFLQAVSIHCRNLLATIMENIWA